MLPDNLHLCITFSEEGICQMKGAIWKFPEIKEYTNDILQLDKLADIDTTPYGTDLKTIAYHPTDCKKIVSVVDNNFVLWDLANKEPQVLITFFTCIKCILSYNIILLLKHLKRLIIFLCST